MEHLSKEFWSSRYENESTGWDLGTISPPIKAYFDQVYDKECTILIPGCGNGHEAQYLHSKGFKNVHVLDFANEPLIELKRKISDFPVEHIHNDDFFKHEGAYDIIIEQTLFCAIDPKLRNDYAHNALRLLKDNGKLVGLFFEFELNEGPPYGGSKSEYMNYFREPFSNVSIEKCYNSVKPRDGRELFAILRK